MICAFCGKQFVLAHGGCVCRHMPFCSDRCRNSHKQGLTFKPRKSLSEWSREADECNLDYGNYRALIAQGKTFEQLKATAHLRQIPAHATRPLHGFQGGNRL